MIVKEDYLRQIRDVISQYPTVALLYQAGDPRLLASLEAIATMLAMISQQLEVSLQEPFSKVRDATVLADAALKGVLPMARAARVSVNVKNPSNAPYALQSGRRILDSNGRLYVVEAAVTIPAGQTLPATAVQRETRLIQHTVAESRPFYSIELPPPQDDRFISGVAVTRVADGMPFAYSPEFCNTFAGDKTYNVETDEYRRLYLRFGYRDVVGTQPDVGEQFNVVISECNGDARPDQGSPFTLEYTLSPQDTQIGIAMVSQLEAGTAPVDMRALRELTRYPAVYSDNAVFMGEFDFLIRKRFPTIQFLSVWNEQIEERVRGASFDNINVLFISVLPAAGNDQVALEAAIKEVVLKADDSYRVRFVPAVDRLIYAQINVYLPIVNSAADVAAAITEAVIAEYGADSAAVKRGMLTPQYSRLYDRLRNGVPALADSAADINIIVSNNYDDPLLVPEQRRYISADSLTVTVTPVRQNLGNWGV